MSRLGRPSRRRFLAMTARAAGLAAAGGLIASRAAADEAPNVILIRYGGGVRRRETIDPDHGISPFLRHEFIPRGTLFSNMEIAGYEWLNTGHGEGTLNIVTGHYDKYEDLDGRFLGARFEAKVPTIFEYLRKAHGLALHQTLMINGEDRPDEEFYTFSRHMAYGIDYRCSMLSLYRFRLHRLQQRLAMADLRDDQRVRLAEELAKLVAVGDRTGSAGGQGPEIAQFWDRFDAYYGGDPSKTVRGDRLLTELAVRAIGELRPRLMMVNFQDCDYVHWGNPAHYTRAIAVMDEGLRRIVDTVEADEAYRDSTVFVVAPDCGRDNNALTALPFQHHFNTRSAHEVFALLVGRGIAPGRVVDRTVDQSQIAATIGQIMGFAADHAEPTPLAEAFA